MSAATIKIGTLAQFSDQAFHRALGGYTSTHKYKVSKVETPEHTHISLELVALEGPYVKTFDTTEEELERYWGYLAEGLSLGAYDGERLVGLAICEPRRWNGTLWVWEFGVDPDYRRQGVGRRMMEALAEVARAAGLRALVCETQNTNLPAITFYRAVGFEIEGIDLSYYTNEDVEDFEVALFMKRKLTPPALSPSARKVQEALITLGLPLQVEELPASTRTALEAAQAVGCQVGQIVKSLVFRRVVSGKPVLIMVSGSNRVNEVAVGALIGEPIGKADAEFVRQHTGFAIGGVPPVGHSEPLETLIDEDLMQYSEVWAAAGTPKAVFRVKPDDLVRMTGGRITRIT